MMISRRKLLAGIFGGVAVAPAAYYVARPQLCETCLARYFPAAWADAKLGQHFLVTVLKGVEPSSIHSDLAKRLPWYSTISPRRALRRVARIEYFSGETFVVDGWVLPKTLVLLCTAAFLDKTHVY